MSIKTRTRTPEDLRPEYGPSITRIGVRAGLFFAAFLLSAGILIIEKPGGLGGGREFIVGDPAPRSLFAPFQVQYVDEKATDKLRARAGAAVRPLYAVDPAAAKNAREKVDKFFLSLHDAGKLDAKNEAAGETMPLILSDSALKSFLEEPSLEDARKSVEILLERNLAQGMVDENTKKALMAGDAPIITMLQPQEKKEQDVAVQDLVTPGDIPEVADRILPENVSRNKGLKAALIEIVRNVSAANLIYDEKETQERRKKAADSVTPVEHSIKKDELIVQRGKLITPEEKEKVTHIQKKMAGRKILNRLGGAAATAAMAYLFCFLYLNFFDRRTLRSYRLVLLILTVFILTLALCKTIALWPGSSDYLMPAALAPLLVVLLADARLGLMSALVMAILSAPLSKFSPVVVLAALVSGMAAALASMRVRKRSQFLKIGAAAGLSYGAAILAFQIFQETGWPESLQVSAFGLANGLLVVMPLSFLVLPILESLFNLTTDITLLELSDLNHPLLKRMIVEAPGTYHHSLVVATLGESACEAIGANALLARVGCYFHDIGKIARAEFFTENQQDKNASKHERLTPTMSSLIIVNHVKDGIELGRRYKLKERILRFIPEHQGTGIVYFFYKKALDTARPGEKINPDDYRYPGPKPQSRETAVALLSDSVEAASRSLQNPSPESIRQLVRKIINDKFIDGQLDECDLTLRDLHKIQESFVYNLMAIFHTRVRYPAIKEEHDRPDLFRENPAPDKIRSGPGDHPH